MAHKVKRSGLRADFRFTDFKYDPWGSAMGFFFDLASEMYHRGLDIPSEWGYAPGMCSGDVREHESAHFEECEGASDEELLSFGQALNRYVDFLRFKGKDY